MMRGRIKANVFGIENYEGFSGVAQAGSNIRFLLFCVVSESTFLAHFESGLEGCLRIIDDEFYDHHHIALVSLRQ